MPGLVGDGDAHEAHTHAADFDVDMRHALGVGANAGQVARVVLGAHGHAVGSFVWIEVAAGTVAVATGAVALFVHMKAVLGMGCQAQDVAAYLHLLAHLNEMHCPGDMVAARRLELRCRTGPVHGAVAGHDAGTAGKGEGGRSSGGEGKALHGNLLVWFWRFKDAASDGARPWSFAMSASAAQTGRCVQLGRACTPSQAASHCSSGKLRSCNLCGRCAAKGITVRQWRAMCKRLARNAIEVRAALPGADYADPSEGASPPAVRIRRSSRRSRMPTARRPSCVAWA